MDQIKETNSATIDDPGYEFTVKETLRNERKEIKTFEELTKYLKMIKDDYNTGYGTAPRAIAQACLAVGWYLSGVFGITGFQAGTVMWDFIQDWALPGNQCGAKLVDYDKMLFPQYRSEFTRTIPKGTWDCLKGTAEKWLAEHPDAHPEVLAHWKSIVDGKVPFKYAVVKE